MDVKCAGNSGVESTTDMLFGADRYCDVEDMGRALMLFCADGATKLKLDDV
jgi:hypothetical protein